MRRLLCVALLIAGLPTLAAAQTPTVPSDRLGWTQAMSAADVPQITFAAFVDDGARTVLTQATCTVSATAGVYDCVSPYPPMTPGVHTIELIAILTIPDGTNPPLVVESPRSAAFPIRLVVAPSAPGSLRNVRGGD